MADEKRERDGATYRVTDVRASIHYAGAGGRTRTVKTGQTASDIPAGSVGWMLDRGWLEKTKTISIPAKPAPAPDAKGDTEEVTP